MAVLTVNAGSSTVKLALFQGGVGGGAGEKSLSRTIDVKGAEPGEVLGDFLSGGGEVGVAAHRVVHGGGEFTEPTVIDDRVEETIDRLGELAPLHNPSALAWIRAAREALAGASHVAVFDTSLYARMPGVARCYAIPPELAEKRSIRRYGFHGIAHGAMLGRVGELDPGLAEGKVVTFQLGAGCSVTAFRGGRAVDTSMGFSPLEGLVMATRSGDLDPALVPYLERTEGMTGEEVERLLNRSSGLLGLSGETSDMKALLESGSERARFAVELYCYRARKYLGAYMAVLGGLDAVVFGGGVGENSAEIRGRILKDMGWCGITLDDVKNREARGREAEVGSGRARVFVIPTDESVVMAREALRVAGPPG